MSAISSSVRKRPEPRSGKKFFTLDEACRALALVRRIALDLQATHREHLNLHKKMNGAGDRPMEELEAMAAQFEELTDRRNELVRELEEIGVQLKDPAMALLDFPAKFQSREILLCWQGGEATITHWHELYSGYEGRQPVALLNG